MNSRENFRNEKPEYSNKSAKFGGNADSTLVLVVGEAFACPTLRVHDPTLIN